MFFFFSSRRRHTRSDRDWSSDVCSSDLEHIFERHVTKAFILVCLQVGEAGECLGDVALEDVLCRVRARLVGIPQRLDVGRKELRSEERRVGKECRSRWGAEQLEKKKKDR